jgi:hypothetical protein
MGRNLVRPDGSLVRVADESQAQKLLTLGYREESPTQELERTIEAGQRDYYTSGLEQVKTTGEGLASGLTLGVTDLLSGDRAGERARYNPGLRVGSELLGGLLPLGGGPLKLLREVTPAGKLAVASERAGVALGRGSKTAEAIIRGGVEGAGIGAGQAVSTAQLNGDPITAEAVLAGIGWGALYGGGISGLGAGVASSLEARAAKRAVDKGDDIFRQVPRTDERASAFVNEYVNEGLRKEGAKVSALEDRVYSRFKGTMDDVVSELKTSVKAVEGAADLNFDKIGKAQQSIYSQLLETGGLFGVKKEADAFTKHFAVAKQAAKDGNWEKMNEYLDKFKDNMVVIEQKIGAKFFPSAKVVGMADEIVGVGKMRLDQALAAAEETTKMEALRSALSGFPKSADEFTSMTPARVEKLSAAIDQVGKLRSAEFDALKASVKDSVDSLTEALGVSMEGTPGGKLQGTWKLLKDGRGVRAAKDAERLKKGNLLWDDARESERKAEFTLGEGGTRAKEPGRPNHALNTALRYGVGSWTAKATGTGVAGYALGSGLVSALVNLKGAVLGTIADKALKWVPKAARGLEKVGPRVEPLATKLNGFRDDEKRSRTELMKARAKEVLEAAPGVRDTIYKAVSPLGIQHPELAANLQKHAVARYQYLLSKLPKDPGLAYSNLESLWKPDAVAVEKFARVYEVFQNPVAVVARALETGKITLEAADALENMDPELFQYLRVEMLHRISDPEVKNKMSYEDQVHVGMMLKLTLHSTMDPRFISAQQQMYTERNKPLEMNPRIQPGGGAGRPSGPGPSATSAQRIGEH